MKTTLTILLWLGLLLGYGASAAAGAEGLGEVELEVKRAQRQLAELVDEIGRLKLEGFSFVPEERFIDATIYCDLKHNEMCSLLLSSLVEDPKFKQDRLYFEGVRMLGVAFFNQGNLIGAQRQFERLRSSGVFPEVAMGFLVEIAQRLGRDAELRKLADSISLQGSSATLLYIKGKALYFVRDYERAVDVLKRVAPSGADGAKAQYVTGASLVALGRVDDAQRVFTALVAGAKFEPEDELQQLSFMALGRLAYEKGEFSAAADYYQRVPRQSPHFERSLYEVTHVYIRWAAAREETEDRMRSFAKAEELLDILVSLTQDPELAREARTLRGRISMFLEKYEQAQEAYQEVIDLFAATSGELTDLAQDPKNIEKFFDMMIRSDSSDSLNLFVSAEVISWMKTQPDLGRVVDMLSDVSEQRRTIEEARSIYQQLSFSLGQPNAWELFPGFSDVWLKSLEVENRLLDADTLLLDLEQAAVRSRLDAVAQGKLDRILAQRRAMENQLASAPRTVTAYRTRSQATQTRVRSLAKDLDEQLLRLRSTQEEILAMQKLIKEVKYKGSTALQVKDEQQILKELQQEGEKVAEYIRQANALRLEAEKQMLAAEVGDPLGRSEQDARVMLWKQHGEEAKFYIEVASGLDSTALGVVEAANAMRRDIFDTMNSVRGQRESVAQKGQKLVRYYQQLLAEERGNLDRRDSELRAVEAEAVAFSREVGAALFIKAKEELVKAVIEADLGLVDLTWQRKKDETDRIGAIQEERGRVIDRLREELRAIAGDESQE
ncbi:MAG: hypothetical protein FJ109_09645 [Deltaproteobacteria bacterium]|nr:hypothetical protein [Deltaproteobacteria bacterium]